MPAVHNRTDVLVRLVARCDTAPAMPTRPTLPSRSLRLLLVAGSSPPPRCPGRAAAATGRRLRGRGGGRGVRRWVGGLWTTGRGRSGSATLPHRGPRFSGVGLPRGSAAPRAGSGPGRVRARYAILVDPATGAVLWGRRSRTSAPPASLTKMLTALAVRASLDLDGVTVASRTAAASRPAAWPMRRGQKLTVDQALKALMMVSANDVAVMLAEAAGGSVARFSRAMDAESELLGLRASSWRNPHGLDARWPPLDRLRPGHPGQGRPRGPLAGPGRAPAPRGLHHARAAAATPSPPAPGSCSATGAPSGSRPGSPTTPATAWPPRPPGAGGP